MLKIISWWVRNSKAANLLMFSIIIIGILNFFRVEKEVFPVITAPVVSIKYGWPGASPKEIEDQILVRVEESLTDLDNVKKITSTARENLGSILVEATSGSGIDKLIQDIKRKVDSIESIPDGCIT